MENQQFLLREAMKTLALQRKEFAAALDCSPRILAAYLLPNDSQGFRNMLPPVEQRMMTLLREYQMAQQHGFVPATLDPSVPPVVCTDFDFHFPTLYRLEGDSHIKGYPRVGATKGDRLYTLSAVAMRPSEVRNPRITPIARRTDKTDEGWVIINEHRTHDRADAYVYAVLQTLPESLTGSMGTYQYEGRIFTLLHRTAPERARYDCVTIYRSDAYEKIMAFPFITPSATHQEKTIWQLNIGPDGEPIDDDLFIEDAVDLSGITLVQE